MEELIKNSLINNYLFNVQSIEKNEDSTDGNVYMINTDSNKYVIKVYDDFNKAESMSQLHSFLKENGIYVPDIVPSKDGNKCIHLDNIYIIVYTFLEGEKIGNWFKDDEEVIKAIARELRKIHDLTTGDNTYNLKEVPFDVDQSIERKSVLHFDLTKDNIFYNDGTIGFIDFDDAKYGPSIIDVAIISSLLFITKRRGFELDKIKSFIKNYYADNIDKNEIQYIKDIALTWVNYIMDNNEFDTSTNESFAVKKRLIEEELNPDNIIIEYGKN